MPDENAKPEAERKGAGTDQSEQAKREPGSSQPMDGQKEGAEAEPEGGGGAQSVSELSHTQPQADGQSEVGPQAQNGKSPPLSLRFMKADGLLSMISSHQGVISYHCLNVFITLFLIPKALA